MTQDLRNTIETRIKHLEMLMKGQAHLDRPEYTTSVIESITKFWSILDDADRDYIQCVSLVVEEKARWE
tara:strand:- start:576 stop:782 length:207 start_codon:yes stop_codon:yes gene_type:complete